METFSFSAIWYLFFVWRLSGFGVTELFSNYNMDVAYWCGPRRIPNRRDSIRGASHRTHCVRFVIHQLALSLLFYRSPLFRLPLSCLFLARRPTTHRFSSFFLSSTCPASYFLRRIFFFFFLRAVSRFLFSFGFFF